MVEHDSGSSQEYTHKYDIRTGVALEHPEGWYYHTKDEPDSERVCTTPKQHDDADYYSFGLSIIVYPLTRAKIRNARNLIEKFPIMFKDMKAVGSPFKREEEGNRLSVSHEFEGEERVYTVEVADGIQKDFLMPDRFFIAGITIDT